MSETKVAVSKDGKSLTLTGFQPNGTRRTQTTTWATPELLNQHAATVVASFKETTANPPQPDRQDRSWRWVGSTRFGVLGLFLSVGKPVWWLPRHRNERIVDGDIRIVGFGWLLVAVEVALQPKERT